MERAHLTRLQNAAKQLDTLIARARALSCGDEPEQEAPAAEPRPAPEVKEERPVPTGGVVKVMKWPYDTEETIWPLSGYDREPRHSARP